MYLGVVILCQMQVTEPSMSLASLFAKYSILLVSVLRPFPYEYGFRHLTVITKSNEPILQDKGLARSQIEMVVDLRLCVIPKPTGSYRLFCQPCGSSR